MSCCARQVFRSRKMMGKRGAKKLTSGPNLKSVLRHEHLKNLALWSTPIPSLATLFGRRLAEATGVAPDLVSCQRCETILQPGFNCNVRIEKSKKKHIKINKSNVCLAQNNVVYNCNFCCHRNLKRGTTKGQMKKFYPSTPKTTCLRPKSTTREISSNMRLSSPERPKVENSVVTTPKPVLTLNRDKRIRKSISKKPVEPESLSKMKTVGGSSKRKRKSWTSMKEINETNQNSSRGKIPFHL